MKKENRGFLICWVVLSGLIGSLVFHWVQGTVMHRDWPYNSFLFRPNDALNDFRTYFMGMRSGTPFSYRGNVYFPFAYLLLYPFLPLRLGVAYVLIATGFLATAFYFLRQCFIEFEPSSRRLIVTTLVFAAYPTLYCLDRGNLEMIVFIFLAMFVLFYKQNRMSLAVVCLSAATAMKGYPLAFGALFLADRKYKEIVHVLALTLTISLLSTALLPQGFKTSVLDLAGNLHILQRQIKGGAVGLLYSDSLFSVVMHLGHQLFARPYDQVYSAIEWLYPTVCMASFSALVVYIVRVETVFWRRLTLLTFAIILFPQVSHDYKLIHLLIPISAFITAAVSDFRTDTLYSYLFGLLLISKSYYFVSGSIPIGVYVNPLIMLVFIGVMLWERHNSLNAYSRS